jgi:hypothetical protein
MDIDCTYLWPLHGLASSSLGPSLATVFRTLWVSLRGCVASNGTFQILDRGLLEIVVG